MRSADAGAVTDAPAAAAATVPISLIVLVFIERFLSRGLLNAHVASPVQLQAANRSHSPSS